MWDLLEDTETDLPGCEQCPAVTACDPYAFYDSVSYAVRTNNPMLQDFILLGVVASGSSPEKKRSKKLTPEDVYALAGYEDRVTAEEILKALDPGVLKIVREYLVPEPGQNLFDNAVPENRLRNMFIRCGTFQPPADLGSMYVTRMGSKYSLLDSEGNVLIVGSSYDLLEYATQFSGRRNVLKVYRQLKDYCREGIKLQNLQELLHLNRGERRYGSTVEKFSKVSQLGTSERDNPYNWFKDLPFTEQVENWGVDWRSTIRFSDVAPRGAGEGRTILIDVVRGDHDGAIRNKTDKLLEAIDTGQSVVAHCVLADDLLDRPGLFLYKPRPHNLTAVVEFADEHPPLAQSCVGYTASVLAANDWRNGRFYGQGIVARNWYFDMGPYLLDLFTADSPPKKDKRRMVKKRRIKELDVRKKVRGILEDDNALFLDVSPIKGQFVMLEGPLHRMAVTNIPPMLQASLLISQARKEGRAVYENGCWRYVPRKLRATVKQEGEVHHNTEAGQENEV